jgi:hypothetical protein
LPIFEYLQQGILAPSVSIPNHGLGSVVSGYRAKILGSRLTQHTVGSGSGFLVAFFGLVGRGFFLDSGQNSGPRLICRTVRSVFFFSLVESGLSSRPAHDQVYSVIARSIPCYHIRSISLNAFGIVAD